MLRDRVLLWLLLLAGCARAPAGAADAGASVEGTAPGESLPLVGRPSDAGQRAALDGRVLWRGPRPELPPLETNATVERVCGRTVADGSVQVDASGGVAEVVVWLETGTGAAPPRASEDSPAAVLDQRGCRYLPAVLAARAGSSLRFRNSDPLIHTVHVLFEGQTLFNLAMPLEHTELVRRLPGRPGTLDLKCDVHPWMRAWVRIFDHPYFTVSDAEGRFRLEQLPVGEGRVGYWHPVLGQGVRPVRIGAGQLLELELGGVR